MNNKKKLYDLLDYLLLVTIIVLLNIIASQYFFRLDLTEEKRYTISEATKNTLHELDDIVYIEVYLEGSFPAGFKRLQRSVRETLDEFRIYGGANIQYKFTDPTAGKDERQKSQVIRQLAERGVQPTNLFANEDGKQTEKLVFPGAIISYKGKELPVIFLKGAGGAGPAEALNQSVEGVEYELIAAIKKLTQYSKKRVAILEGHGEASNQELDEIYRSLRENYLVERVNLGKVPDLKTYFDLLIVARPTRYFSEEDKLKIDQFIVKGGRALFFVDKVDMSPERLSDENYIATAYDLNIDDLLFRYGVRLNNSIIRDLQCGTLPMVTGMMGNQPQTQMVPWMYYPVHTQFGKHPTVRNMGSVLTKFTGSIDTVKALGITKTPLMYSSNYANERDAPLKISLDEAKKEPDMSSYSRKAGFAVAYLLEGSFKSLYSNRLTQQKQDSIGFKAQLTDSKIIVFSDGNLVCNELTPDKSQVFPLGFDRYMRKKFANKDLIDNCITFLLDENGIINTRSKEIKLRPLDKQKIKNERTKWQIINVLLPVLLVIAFGFAKYYVRKKKFEM